MGGGEEFGVGDVVGDFGASDGGGEDEGAAATALLLVGAGEGDEPGGGGLRRGGDLERRDGAVAEDKVGHSGEVFRGDEGAVEREVQRGDRTPRNRLAMQQLAVVRGRLDGVADGVAEVQDHAQAGLLLVLADDLGLDADAGGDDLLQGGGVSRQDGVAVLLHEAEEGWVADDGGLNGLLQAGAEFGGGESAEKVDVAEDGEGVVEGADEVLAGEEVDAGLAAEGGIDLGEHGGGQANVADSAHVDGGEEARDVADDAAAEGKQDGVAVGPGEGKLLGEGLDCGEALVGLAGGKKKYGELLGFGFWKAEESYTNSAVVWVSVFNLISTLLISLKLSFVKSVVFEASNTGFDTRRISFLLFRFFFISVAVFTHRTNLSIRNGRHMLFY